MKNIGFILKNARENKGYTQKQVMSLTNINSKSLSELYDLSADDVLEIKTPILDTHTFNNESTLISLYRSLDTTHQEDFLLVLQTLSKKYNEKP